MTQTDLQDSSATPRTSPSAILASVYFYLLFLGALWPIGCISRWDAALLVFKVLPLGLLIGLVLAWSAVKQWSMGVSLLLVAGLLFAGKWIGHPVILGILTATLLFMLLKRRSAWLPAFRRALPRHTVVMLLLLPCSMMSVSAMQYVGIDVWNDVLTGQISIDS